MKYFYFQMLKDKKIIIHKTDGKKHSFPLQEEATEQTPHMDSACLFKFSFCVQS